jgi:hypothetical protein
MHVPMIRKTPPRWLPSCKDALKSLNDNGVKTKVYPGDIGADQQKFNGEWWKP